MEGRQTLFPPLFIRTIPTSSTTTTSQPIIVRADDTSEIEFLGGSGDDSTKPTNASVTGFQGEGWTIALVVLTSVRLLVLLTLWIYLTRRTLRSKVSLHRVWVSQLLLAAIALSHLVLYAFVVNPNPVSCGIIRIGLGMAHATPFAILVLKIVLIVSCNKGKQYFSISGGEVCSGT